MNESYFFTINKIRELGGELAADLLNVIFRTIEIPFGDSFDVEEFFDQLTKRYSGEADFRKYHRGNFNQPEWTSSGSNTDGSINVIPSTSKGVCCQLCLTIAKGGFNGRRGLPPYTVFNDRYINLLMYQLAAYWFSCQNINRETIVLTPKWNQEEFDVLYKPLIDAYTLHGKKVFLVEIGKSGAIIRYPY